MNKMLLPDDIVRKIKNDFSDDNEKEKVRVFLMDISSKLWNVGHAQLSRSILFLLGGNIDKLKEFEKISDPRDIISLAHEKSNGKYDYFNIPFDI